MFPNSKHELLFLLFPFLFFPIEVKRVKNGRTVGNLGRKFCEQSWERARQKEGRAGCSRKTLGRRRRSGQMINELLLNRELSYRAAINIVPDKVTNLKEIQYKSHGNSIGDLILAEELSLATETPLITPFSSPLLSTPLSLPPS